MISRRAILATILGTTAGGTAAALSLRPQWGQVIRAYATTPVSPEPIDDMRVFALADGWAKKLIAAAENQIGKTLSYDPNYSQIAYPDGDVPIERGVCTDVIIRAYRDGLGVDLQKLVHEDMATNFSKYPHKWGLKKPDSNIDHRRVPNLQTFFARKKSSMPLSLDGKDYQPGDVVTMNLPGNLTHIALVTHRPTPDAQRPLCVHNIGAGARLDDTLFAFELTGHFRFNPVAA
jgi:uncharacterized protein